ncbi:signal peptidase I [Curtobacterium sp. MCLR17_042]|nr:signal peptidase I [Curtobacterium sp. MCLR17_042]
MDGRSGRRGQWALPVPQPERPLPDGVERIRHHQPDDRGRLQHVRTPAVLPPGDVVTTAVPQPPPQPQGARWSGALRLLGQTAAVLLLIVVVGLAALAILVPRITGSVPLTVLTSSMEPGMPPGTLAVVRPVDPSDIGVGDIVTYQIRVDRPGVISHRVVAVAIGADGRRLFTFKGDNNSAVDPERVVAAQVMGRVWYSIPGLGFVNTAVAGDTRAWLVPTLGGGMIGYALLLVIRSVAVTGARGTSHGRRRRAAPAVRASRSGRRAGPR